MAKIIGYHSDSSPCYTDGCKLGHVNKQTVSQSLETENVSAFLDAKTEQDKMLTSDFEAETSDSFASSWASGVHSQREEMQAELDANNGKHEFPALFDLDGNRINAFPVQTKYGQAWMVCNESGQATGKFLNPSKAQNPERAKAANEKKGFHVGKVMSPAYIRNEGSGFGLSGAHTVRPVLHQRRVVDPADVIVLDNGNSPDEAISNTAKEPAKRAKRNTAKAQGKSLGKTWEDINEKANSYPEDNDDARIILKTIAGSNQDDAMSSAGVSDYLVVVEQEAEEGVWDKGTVAEISKWFYSK